MSCTVLKLDAIKKEYNNFIDTNKPIDSSKLSKEHLEIREFFNQKYNELKLNTNDNYNLDLELGLSFYTFINSKKYFNNLYACDYDFRRTIAVFDIPNIIADRFGLDKGSEAHFYSKGTRVYPFALYRYIHLSRQGDVSSTREVLKGNTTDEIMQVVERPGKEGVNISLYRQIMKEYSNKKYNELKKKIKKMPNATSNFTLFRMILIRHTEKSLIFCPETFPGGIENYIKMLFDVEGALYE